MSKKFDLSVKKEVHQIKVHMKNQRLRSSSFSQKDF